jgi:hypothetical protein
MQVILDYPKTVVENQVVTEEPADAPAEVNPDAADQ